MTSFYSTQSLLHSAPPASHQGNSSNSSKGSADQRKHWLRRASRFLQQACTAMGFPTKTLATAQLFLVRYASLSCPGSPSAFMDVAMVCLFIATKSEETVKKLRLMLPVVHPILVQQLLKMTKEEVQVEMNMDEYRKRLIVLEKQVLEVNGFQFDIAHPHHYVIKFAKLLNVSRELAWRAHRFCLLSYQTPLALEWPFYTIALSSLFLACQMQKSNQKDSETLSYPFDEKAPRLEGEKGPLWYKRWPVDILDVRVVARVILDEMVDCEELFGYPFDDCQAIRIQLNQFLDKARLKKQEESPSVKPILAPPPRHEEPHYDHFRPRPPPGHPHHYHHERPPLRPPPPDMPPDFHNNQNFGRRPVSFGFRPRPRPPLFRPRPPAPSQSFQPHQQFQPPPPQHHPPPYAGPVSSYQGHPPPPGPPHGWNDAPYRPMPSRPLAPPPSSSTYQQHQPQKRNAPSPSPAHRAPPEPIHHDEDDVVDMEQSPIHDQEFETYRHHDKQPPVDSRSHHEKQPERNDRFEKREQRRKEDWEDEEYAHKSKPAYSERPHDHKRHFARPATQSHTAKEEYDSRTSRNDRDRDDERRRDTKSHPEKLKSKGDYYKQQYKKPYKEHSKDYDTRYDQVDTKRDNGDKRYKSFDKKYDGDNGHGSSSHHYKNYKEKSGYRSRERSRERDQDYRGSHKREDAEHESSQYRRQHEKRDYDRGEEKHRRSRDSDDEHDRRDSEYSSRRTSRDGTPDRYVHAKRDDYHREKDYSKRKRSHSPHDRDRYKR